MIDDESEESEIDGLVALFEILVLNLGAATLTEYEKGIRHTYIVMYTIVAVAVLCAMSYVTTQTRKRISSIGTEELMFRHSRTTVGLGKGLFTFSLILVCAFTALASTGRWPGQKRTEFLPKGAVLTSSEDGSPCLRVKVAIGPKNFGGRVPESFSLFVLIDGNDEVNNRWQLIRACFRTLADDEAISRGVNPATLPMSNCTVIKHEPPDHDPVEAKCSGFEEAVKYVVYLDYRPYISPADANAVQDFKADCDCYRDAGPDKRKELAATWKAKYQVDFDKAEKDIMGSDHLKIWQKVPFWSD